MTAIPLQRSGGAKVGARQNRAMIFAMTLTFALLVTGCASPWRNESADLEAQDSQLALTVKAALIEAPGLAGSAIDVASAGGRVTLTGFVETETQRDQAVEVAGDQAGVSRVVDEIVVK